jgi:hypothetical protein
VKCSVARPSFSNPDPSLLRGSFDCRDACPFSGDFILLKRIVAAGAGFGMVMLFIQQCSSGGSAASAAPGGFFPAPEQESSSIAIVRGKDDRQHMAFTGYDGKTKDFIYYGVCDAADCGTSRDNWQVAQIPFAGASKIQIALTPDGKPRLHVVSHARPNQSGYNRSYSYGECDDDCADPDS